MEIIIVANEEEVGRVAADKVIEHLSGLATPVIGLATGSSPLGLYAELARRQDEGDIDFSHALGFALDEYVGIDPAHPESYRNVINRTVVEPLRMAPERVRVPDGAAEDLEAAVEEYDAAIEAVGGVDVQVLGIGSNGHIGFNEPHTRFSCRTHVAPLSAQTRRDNGRFFSDPGEVPTHAITLGIRDILEAREILLVATGPSKARIMAELYHSPVDEALPASALKQHPNVTILLDRETAALIPLRGQTLKPA